MTAPRGAAGSWLAFTAVVWDAVVCLQFGGMAWMMITHPSVLAFYGVLLAVMASVAYLMWRVRRARARRASKAMRQRLDLREP